LKAARGRGPRLGRTQKDEVAISAAFGIPVSLQTAVSYAAGTGDVLLGILFFQRRAWPQLASTAVTVVLLVFVVIYVPRFLVGAFKPVVMHIASRSSGRRRPPNNLFSCS
jgi:hypothetical protein